MPDRRPIIVLEDDRAVAKLIGRVLQMARIANPIEYFTDGDDVRGHLRAQTADRPAPVLALLDVNVPGCSGFDVLQQIRGDPVLAALPVIMLSGSEDERDIERAYASGATAYLVKPAGIHGLRDMLGDLGLRVLLLPGDA